MKEQTQALEHASVKQYCKALRVPIDWSALRATGGAGDQRTAHHIGYLEALLTDGIGRTRPARHSATAARCQTAPSENAGRVRFNQARQIPAAKIRELAEGGYIERAEPVVLMGECGTGKTHLATGLCVAACRQKRRARFTTAANLVNELVEARQHNAVKRVTGALVAL